MHKYLFQGLILGFAMAVPVGPIGILCIRRSLNFGKLSGLFSGLGAAVADTLFGAIAAFGLTFICDWFMNYQSAIRFLGGGFLLYLGASIFTSKSHQKTLSATHRTLLSDFISTFILTLTNPLTILSYLAIFAGFGLCSPRDSYIDACWIVLGVFLGSSLWWLILSEGIGHLRHRITTPMMVWINHLAGALIIGFGALAWISLAMSV